MAEETHHHLQEAEHARHAAQDPFDRRVAMTMTIIAALLAVVTMLVQRETTATLRSQTQSGALHTRASDAWAYYQAKNIRSQQYQSFLELSRLLAPPPAGEAPRRAAQGRWGQQVTKYEQELPQLESQARALEKEAEQAQAQSDYSLHRVHRMEEGELGLELGLILCSIAVLTKRRGYWLFSMACAVAGLGVAGSAWLA